MREYRPPSGALAAHLASAAFFEGVGVWGAIDAIRNVHGSYPRPVEIAFMFVAIASVAGLYIVVEGIRLHTERVLVGDDTIELRRWGRSRVVAWHEFTSAKWRTWPNCGSVVLRALRLRFAISFQNYKSPPGRELIAELRDRLPSQVQLGWPVFEKQYFPDEAERQRRQQRFNQPLPRWAEALLVAVMIALAMALAWFVVAGNGPYRSSF